MNKKGKLIYGEIKIQNNDLINILVTLRLDKHPSVKKNEATFENTLVVCNTQANKQKRRQIFLRPEYFNLRK